MYRYLIKRGMDIGVSLTILIILLPFLVTTALLVIIDLKGNPFFVQPRPGKKAKIFKLLKFRTMSDAVDEKGQLLPDYKRITRIGKFLRKYSLDELLQFINVLKGDMSLVGPRPLLVKYLPYYSERQFKRHEVKPGITGLAQVSGRNKLTWEEKFELDVYYAYHYNFLMDIKILFLTLIQVLKREGIDYSKNITMTPFRGTKESMNQQKY